MTWVDSFLVLSIWCSTWFFFFLHNDRHLFLRLCKRSSLIMLKSIFCAFELGPFTTFLFQWFSQFGLFTVFHISHRFYSLAVGFVGLFVFKLSCFWLGESSSLPCHNPTVFLPLDPTYWQGSPLSCHLNNWHFHFRIYLILAFPQRFLFYKIPFL